MGSPMSNNTSRTRNLRLFFSNSLSIMLEIIGNDQFSHLYLLNVPFLTVFWAEDVLWIFWS